MKRLLSLILCIVTITVSTPFSLVNASSNIKTGRCGKNVKYTLNLKKKTLTIYGTGDMYDYEYGNYAPFAYIGGYETVIFKKGVTSVGNVSFAGNMGIWGGIKTVYLSDTITDIGWSAFSFTELEELHISKSLETIYSDAFRHCPFLKKFVVDKNNKHFKCVDGVLYSKDMSVLYSYPSRLNKGKKYVMPDSVTEMRAHAFQYSRLKKIKLSKNLVNIASEAFYLAKNPLNLTLYKKLEFFDPDAFYLSGGIKKLVVSKNNPYLIMQDDVLYTKDKSKMLYVTKLAIDKKVLKTPAELKEVVASAFVICETSGNRLEKVVFNEGLTDLHPESYLYAKNITLPSTLKKLEHTSLNNYHNRTFNVYLNGDIKKIKGQPFLRANVYGKCTAKNVIAHCKKYKNKYKKEIVFSHNFIKDHKYKAPTHFNEGYEKGYCSQCDKNVNETLKKLKLPMPKYSYNIKNNRIYFTFKNKKQVGYYEVKYVGKSKIYKVTGKKASFYIDSNNCEFKIRSAIASGKKRVYSKWEEVDFILLYLGSIS